MACSKSMSKDKCPRVTLVYNVFIVESFCRWVSDSYTRCHSVQHRCSLHPIRVIFLVGRVWQLLLFRLSLLSSLLHLLHSIHKGGWGVPFLSVISTHLCILPRASWVSLETWGSCGWILGRNPVLGKSLLPWASLGVDHQATSCHAW